MVFSYPPIPDPHGSFLLASFLCPIRDAPGSDDVGMMSQTIQEGRCQFLVPKDLNPFGKGEVGGDDGGAALIAIGDEVEQDFIYDPIRNAYRCPNGKTLTYYCKSTTNQYRGRKYRTQVGECIDCPFVDSCLRKGTSRRYLFVVDKGKPIPYSRRMIEIVDSPAGRNAYTRRMAIAEPVFGNIKNNKRMNRFTLRGLPKVTVQWLYYCLVHNIEKIATTGAINRLVMG